MAGPSGTPDPSLISRVATEPRRFRFFQAVRLFEALRLRQERRSRALDSALIGEENDPRQRLLRFGASIRLSFPSAEIDDFEPGGARPPGIFVNFLGLTGPSAVLPQHYSVTVLRETRRRNRAIRDFFDLFNERLIAFFYRAWAKYRVPIAVERVGASGEDGASEALRGVIGFATDHLRGRTTVAEPTLLHYAGLLGHFPRSTTGLAALLSDCFGLPIRVEPFDGRWLALPPDQRSRLGTPGGFATLSVDAAIGESYWDVEGGFAVLIGPLDYAAFESFMPNGQNLQRLADLVRLYANPELGCRVELCLAREEVPRIGLGEPGSPPPLLGWNTWLRYHPMLADARDASFRL